MGANIVTPTHLLLVVVVLLLVFGTKKLPELGRGIGSAMREFKGGVTGAPATPLVASVSAPTPAAQPAPEATPAVVSGADPLGAAEGRRPIV
jgi:sec-independent protein translocase protein TatA